MACQSQGALAQLAINGQAVEFLSCTLGQRTELVDNSMNAIRGTFDHPKERVTQGLKIIRGKIVMEPSPSELDVIIPLLGFAESPTDTFTITDDFSSLKFPIIVDRVAKVHTYAGCIIDKWKFMGQRGDKPIRLELDVIGTTDESEGAAGSFSATAVDTDHNYAFTEGVLTLISSSRPFDRFALAGDNKVFASFNNSQVAECVEPTDKEIYLAVNSPYNTSHSALYTTGITNADGAAGSLVFTRAGKSTTFTFANLKLIGQTPPILGREEIRHPQYYRAYKSGSTASLIITHDNTPA